MTQCAFNHITTLIATVHVQCSCLLSSALGWHLECHRGFPRERHQHHGPQRWPLCGSSRSGAVHHFLPAEQAHAHHPPDHRGALHQPAAQLPAGSLWPVSNTSHDGWPLLGHFHAWGSDVSWCGVKCDSEVYKYTNTDYSPPSCHNMFVKSARGDKSQAKHFLRRWSLWFKFAFKGCAFPFGLDSSF